MAKQGLAEFAERMAENPYQAFRWQKDALRDAARFQLCTEMLNDFANPEYTDVSVAEVQKWLNRICMQAARYGTDGAPEAAYVGFAAELSEDIRLGLL